MLKTLHNGEILFLHLARLFRFLLESGVEFAHGSKLKLFFHDIRVQLDAGQRDLEPGVEWFPHEAGHDNRRSLDLCEETSG